MKKWLLILIICFIFIPKDVFAKSYAIYPYQAELRNNGTLINQSSPFGYAMDGNFPYQVIESTSEVNRITFRYRNLVSSGIDLNNHYDISFKIAVPNFILSNGSTVVDSSPIVLLNDNSCYVTPGSVSTSGASSTVFTKSFAVKCTNVTFNNDTFSIDIFTPTNSAPPTGIFSARYGIGWNLDFSTLFDSDSIITEQQETNDKLDDLNDNITNSDISGASSSASGFFNNFEYKTYGLTDIITAPLTFIQGMSNSTCTDLSLPLPFVDQNIELPCMTSIYEEYFGGFLTIYQIITFGIVGYWVSVNVLRMVNNFKNPDNDEVEVMDL